MARFTFWTPPLALPLPMAVRLAAGSAARPGLGAVGELTLILALVWAALIAHAFCREPLAAFGHELERADLARFFGSPRGVGVSAEPPSAASISAPVVAGPGTKPDPAAAPDPTPQRILILGDSMIEGLLPRLSDYAAHNGHSVSGVIWYGSRTSDWGRGGRLREMLDSYQPTFVFVVLGSSELFVRNVEKRSAAVEHMLAQIGDRKLVWIGPPNWKQDTGINALLERKIGSDRYFRSAELSFERKKDGIHPTLGSSQRWMDAVVSFVTHASRAPIRLETPTKTGTPRPKLRVFSPPSQ